MNELSPQVKWRRMTQSPPLRHTVSLLVRLALTLNKDILSYSNTFFTQKLRTKGNLFFGQNQILYYTHTPILVAAAMVASAVTALSENKYPTTRPNKHFLTISQQ